MMPYVTKDGSTISEFMHPAVHGNSTQSLAEARISKGERTRLHHNLKTEELYHGLAVAPPYNARSAIKTGAPHRVQTIRLLPRRILCCCLPAYSYEDTELLEKVVEDEDSTKVVRQA